MEAGVIFMIVNRSNHRADYGSMLIADQQWFGVVPPHFSVVM